jgi:hypothetical protein
MHVEYGVDAVKIGIDESVVDRSGLTYCWLVSPKVWLCKCCYKHQGVLAHLKLPMCNEWLIVPHFENQRLLDAALGVGRKCFQDSGCP